MSAITHIPEYIKVTEDDVLKRLASEIIADSDTAPVNDYKYGKEFDILDFMQKHGMSYTEDSNDRAKIYKLDECPFDPSHKNGDAKIFLYRNGAISFKCHHNSCSGYKWQDVRLKYEPDAYDRIQNNQIDELWQKHKSIQQQPAIIEPTIPKKIKIRKLKTAHELMQKELAEPRVFIGVDNELPILLEGTCILSAKPKLGKSWLALSMCLAIANGEDFLGYKTHKCSTLYLDLETSEQLQQKRLRKALHGEPIPENFYLDTDTNSIDHGFIEQIRAYLDEDPDIGVVVIDVFQIIRTPAKNMKETDYEHAYRDITPLNELAQEKHISIVLVCHDRKQVDPDDPPISG
jgi:predicted ATP-dependent serine protease